MSYLEYARQAKSTKKFKSILTSVIRLHPTKSELWLYAARWTLESEADMNGARSYMQRGTRFCTAHRNLWIEYAKLEMIYLAKIEMRRKIMGLDIDTSKHATETEEIDDDPGFATSENMIAIPDFDSDSLQPSMIEGITVDSDAAKDPMTTPALNGAIPLAIFDAAWKQPFFCPSVAEDFFDMFTSFSQVRCLPKILQHVLDSMIAAFPADPSTCNCFVKQLLAGIDASSPEFPMAIGGALDRLKESMERTEDRTALSKKTRTWIEQILALDDLDPGIQTVLNYTIRRLNE